MKKVTCTGILLILLTLAFTGCATTIGFDVLKPAEVNMADYRTLAVFDYDPYEISDEVFAGKLILDILFGNSDDFTTTGYRIGLDDDVADYMTERTISTLNRTNYFTVVSQDQIRPYQHSAASAIVTNRILYENLGIEAAILGTIEDLDYYEQVQEREKSVWNDTTQQFDIFIENYFVQEVELGVSYTVIDLKRGQILATKYLSGENSRSTLIENANTFTAPLLEPLYQNIIRGFESTISRQLAPYYVREYRSLKKDETKNPRSEMAEELIKNSQYQQALDIYLDLWYSSTNMAAGFNAAIVYEVLGQFDQAIAIMEEVHDTTRSPDAYTELLRLKNVKAEYLKAASQY